MSFKLVDEAKKAFPVHRLCRVLGVSQSGYFAWKGRAACRRQHQDMVLLAHVRSRPTLSSHPDPSRGGRSSIGEVGVVNGIGQMFAYAVAAPLVTISVRRRGVVPTCAAALAGGAAVLLGIALCLVAGPAAWFAAIAAARAVAGLALLVGIAIPLAPWLRETGRPDRPASELAWG